MPTPPSPMTATVSPTATLAVFEHGADTGLHGAAEQAGDLERRVVGDLHRSADRRDDHLGESAQPDPAVDGPAALRQPRTAVGQHAARHTVAEPAQVHGTAGTEEATAALRLEREDHLVALGERVDARADRLDDAGGLVPEDHGERRRQLSVHEVQVGVADSAEADPYQHLTGARILDLDIVDDTQFPTLLFQQRRAHAADCNDVASVPLRRDGVCRRGRRQRVG